MHRHKTVVSDASFVLLNLDRAALVMAFMPLQNRPELHVQKGWASLGSSHSTAQFEPFTPFLCQSMITFGTVFSVVSAVPFELTAFDHTTELCGRSKNSQSLKP